MAGEGPGVMRPLAFLLLGVLTIAAVVLLAAIVAIALLGWVVLLP